MRSGSKTAKTGIVLIIMALTAFALYYYMVNKAKGPEQETETTVVQDVLLKNLEKDYPATVREVIKYYNEIMQCYYNEEYTEEELEALAGKAMELFDEELAENQNETQYMANLKAEIEDYKEAEIVISSSALASATDVDYYTYNGRECARIRCVYTMRQKTRLQTLKEVYVLRKDDADHWKILGWDVADDLGGTAWEAGKSEQTGESQ